MITKRRKRKVFVLDETETISRVFKHSNEVIHSFTESLLPALSDFHKTYMNYFLFNPILKEEMLELNTQQKRNETTNNSVKLSFRESLYYDEKLYEKCKELIKISIAVNKTIQELTFKYEHAETESKEQEKIKKVLEQTLNMEHTNFEKLKIKGTAFAKNVTMLRKSFKAEFEKYGNK